MKYREVLYNYVPPYMYIIRIELLYYSTRQRKQNNNNWCRQMRVGQVNVRFKLTFNRPDLMRKDDCLWTLCNITLSHTVVLEFDMN